MRATCEYCEQYNCNCPGDLIESLRAENSKLKALLRQLAGRVFHCWNNGRGVDDRLARYAKQARKLAGGKE